MVKSYFRRQLDHSVVTSFTPKNYTHRFLVVANLGAAADYTQEPRYLVETDLPFESTVEADSQTFAARSLQSASQAARSHLETITLSG